MTRFVLVPAAAAGLAARYRARQEAERELVTYLAGILDACGVPPERLEGFDDTTGELLLADPPPEED